jgi:protease I
MANKLEGKRVAFVVTDGFEQVELTGPKEALEKEGALCEIVAPKDKVKGWKHVEWGDEMEVDQTLATAKADAYDALVLPGGVMSPDKLRVMPEVLAFVRGFFDAGKPVGAICHGPWTLIDAGVIEGRNVTSWPTLKTDLVNAGARWVDEEVVVDEGLVTSRKPGDIPAFAKKLVEEISEGRHGVSHTSIRAGKEARSPRVSSR